MRLSWRDALATGFVTVAAMLYALWLTGTGMSGSTRVIGGMVFVLGWAACTSNKAEMTYVYGPPGRKRPPMAYVVVASVMGFAALTAGVITLVSASEAMLTVLVSAIVALWAMSTLRHTLEPRTA
jgi:hypothetical protein